MDFPIIIAVILMVLIGGSLAALGWWKLAAKHAPYRDELGRSQKKPPVEEEVHIIRTTPPDPSA
jgi:hypothetical protein